MFDRIIKERERVGLTTAQLAKEIGKSYEMVRQYENGKSYPGAQVLERMADIGIDVQYVLTGLRSSNASEVAENPAVYEGERDEPDPLIRQKRMVKQMIDETEDAELLADIQALVDALKKQRAMRD